MTRKRKRLGSALAAESSKKLKLDGEKKIVNEKNESLIVIDEVGSSDDDVIEIAQVPSSSNNKAPSPKPKVHLNRHIIAVKKEKLNHVIQNSRPTLPADINQRIEDYKAKFPKAFSHFESQITSHFVDNIQTDLTFWWKMDVRRRLNALIAQSWSNVNLYVVGSTINGCGSFSSDMDLCCCVPQTHVKPGAERNFALSCLRRIQKLMYRNKGTFDVNKIQVIRAKVPILRLNFFSNEHGALEVDLNINNIAGINNSHLIHHYSRIDDRFPQLCLLVKHWAKRNDIGEAMKGTLNSYSIILLCIHFLQAVVSPPVLPNLQETHPERFHKDANISEMVIFQDLENNHFDSQQNKQTAGELLISFFEYYANFDFANWAISIKRGEVFRRETLSEDTFRFKMFIEEPYDGLNTARCVTQIPNFEKIMDAFKMAQSKFLGAFRPCIRKIGVEKVFKI